MKNLYIAFALATSIFFTSTRPMLNICFGAGTAGLAYALFRETEKDNNLGAAKELFQIGAVQAGFGSSIENLRFDIQKSLYNIISKQQDQQNPLDNLKQTIKIEKIVYCTTMLLGSVSVLYGLRDFFQNK